MNSPLKRAGAILGAIGILAAAMFGAAIATPTASLGQETKPHLILEIKDGVVDIELLPEVAPLHVERIVTLTERGDCLLALLAEVNRCWYWFHPLSWWLRQHLSTLAEAACDDAAVDSTGDRARYARHLLEVAAVVSTHRGRVAALGVSMARRTHVETRINSILDFTRPLSRLCVTAQTDRSSVW